MTKTLTLAHAIREAARRVDYAAKSLAMGQEPAAMVERVTEAAHALGVAQERAASWDDDELVRSLRDAYILLRDSCPADANGVMQRLVARLSR